MRKHSLPRAIVIGSLTLGVAAHSQGQASSVTNSFAADPWAISVKNPTERYLATGGQVYGVYKGRTLEMQEAMIGGTPMPSLYLWFGSQRYVVKGRASSSRLWMSDNFYGARYLIREAKTEDDWSLSGQYLRIDSSDARLISGHASITYAQSNSYALALLANGGKLFRGVDGRIQYTHASGAGFGNADVYDLGVAYKIPSKGRLDLHAQLDLQVQTSRGVGSGQRSGYEFRPIAGFAASYRFWKFLSVEANATLLTSGVPYSAGHISALGAFLMYEPGGVAQELRRNPVGYGSVRLVASGSF